MSEDRKIFTLHPKRVGHPNVTLPTACGWVLGAGTEGTHRQCLECFLMSHASPAQEARKGLLSAMTGKVKEVAGAVLGNDSMAAEGQLQQAEAAARKDASA